MLSTRVRQKEGTFYFVSYKAPDLLRKVRFISRFHLEGETIAAQPVGDDEVAQFIGAIEQSDKAFQRSLNRRKVKAIVNFFETAASQPLVPGAVLLFTDETLKFEPLGDYKSMGNLREPNGQFLVIDGQHRVADLHFFQNKHEKEADQIEVPCMIFDGKSADFATEMFVVINSTHTRINKSHLIDLYEKVSWESPEKKFTAKVVNLLYGADDSPFQYKINRLGGRSRQEKWILQSELFNEIHKLVEARPKFVKFDRRLCAVDQLASRDGRRLLAALLRMVHDLGIVSIAEGIETPQAAEFCRDLGFQLMQGYYFGVPAKASEWFRRRSKGDAAEKPSGEAAEPLPAEAEPQA